MCIEAVVDVPSEILQVLIDLLNRFDRVFLGGPPLIVELFESLRSKRFET